MNLETSTPRRANRTRFATASSGFDVDALLREIDGPSYRTPIAANDIIQPSCGFRRAPRAHAA